MATCKLQTQLEWQIKLNSNNIQTEKQDDVVYLCIRDKATDSDYLNLPGKETLESLAWYLSATRAA